MFDMPPLPPDAIYPGVHPLLYPPKQILDVFRITTIGGVDDIWLEWEATRNPPFAIKEIQLLLYEETYQVHDPSLWRRFPEEQLLAVNLSRSMYFHASCLTPNRKYYFTIRVSDGMCWGPFSDPISIDV